MRARLHSLGLTPQLAAIGLGGGLLSGLLGVGGGIVMVPLLVLWAALRRSATRTRSRSARSSRSASPGSRPTASAGEVRYGTAIALAVGSIAGARIGAGLLARIDERLLKIVFGIFLVAVAVLVGPADERPDALRRARRVRCRRRGRVGTARRRRRDADRAVPDARGRALAARGRGDVAARDPADGDRRDARPAPPWGRDLRLALRFGVVGAAGSVLGALLALALPADTLRVVFAVFVGLVGLRLARDGIRGDPHSPES